MKCFIQLLSLLIFASCGTGIIRTNYSLSKVGPFLVSNSLTNPYAFSKKEETVETEFKLIIKNTSNRVEKLISEGSYIEIHGKRSDIDCNPKGKNELNNSEQALIECKFNIDISKNPDLIKKDSIAKLYIRLNSTLYFQSDYKFIIEDFE